MTDLFTDLGSPSHGTIPLRLPAAAAEVEVDKEIAPLVKACWEHGLNTSNSCQGRPDAENYGPSQAYISFKRRLAATVFVALAGPFSWTNKAHRLRQFELPKRADRWTWDWSMEGNVVRFPHRDIPRALAALEANKWNLADLVWEMKVAVPEGTELPEPRICRGCRTIISPSLRRDAVYCSRGCQGRSRHKPQTSTPGLGKNGAK